MSQEEPDCAATRPGWAVCFIIRWLRFAIRRVSLCHRALPHSGDILLPFGLLIDNDYFAPPQKNTFLFTPGSSLGRQ